LDRYITYLVFPVNEKIDRSLHVPLTICGWFPDC
jgi:hypothetical protein